MSKLMKIFAIVALMITATAAASGPADARWRHHGWHHGGWHHGWHHRGWGRGFTFGFGIGLGAPYAYYPPVYYRPYYRPYYVPACRWLRVRAWRHGYWRWRSVRRCW